MRNAATAITWMACLLLLGSCASGYKQQTWTGGFSESRIAEGRYQVYYAGNSFVSTKEAMDLALRRAAELTLEGGYRWFALRNSSSRLGGQAGDPEITLDIEFLESPTQEGREADAVDSLEIIDRTEELAGGELSHKARNAAMRFRSGGI